MSTEEISFVVLSEHGDPLIAHVLLRTRNGSERSPRQERFSDEEGRVSFPVPEGHEVDEIIVGATVPGFWVMRIENAEPFDRLRLSSLPMIRKPGWWLRCMNVDTEDDDRGKHIKIGVVDADFQQSAGIEHIKQTTGPTGLAIGKEGTWGHGEAVCRILADREPMAAELLSVAPGAEVVFADASNGKGGVSGFRAAIAIKQLVSQGVHLLNLSWGHTREDVHVAAALQTASEMGVLVVAAAGNEPGEERVRYPARDIHCVAAGALGLKKWGKKGTLVKYYATAALGRKGFAGRVPQVGTVYSWSECTAGGIEVAAPGIGILVQRGGEVSYALSGTSYASPMVVGVLAIALGRDREYLGMGGTSARTQHARETLKRLSQDVGMERERQGIGVPRLPKCNV
ncbi:S8 family peptidase [Bradyrhizobium sp. DASA03005]|uniref:S8 family peptidase n=1 Tax=Bradyrhizobium sp. SPXBL-02 TaxID=3395912 RepID=UPI003F7285A6